MSTRSQSRGIAERRFGVLVIQAFALAFLLHAEAGSRLGGFASEAPSSVQPVELRGTVTDNLTPSTGFFLQDEPSGIYKHSAVSLEIRTGDLAEVLGATEQGGYAPNPTQRRVETVGRASLALFNSASWWNRQRILIALTGLGGLMLLALAWSVALRRTVLQQTRQIRMQLERQSALDERFRQLFDGAERKSSEAALQESEKRFRAIANYTYDWESWIGPDGNPVWINPAVERMTGYTVNECLGMNNFPAPLIHEQDRDLVVALFRGNSSGGGGE